MRLLHLSDLHITNNGVPIWETDTKLHLDLTIRKIQSMRDIDAILITGDLSDDGSAWSYAYIDSQFRRIGLPTYCCVGNHDNIQMMSQMDYCSMQSIADVCGWKLLNLNSTLPYMARGYFSDKTLRFIEAEVSKDDQPVIIAFHHPSIEPGGWLNRKLLENRVIFNDFISNYSNIRLILYGHTHYSCQHQIGHTLFSSAPSVGFAFNKNLPKFQIAMGEEGMNLINIQHSSITIHTILLKTT